MKPPQRQPTAFKLDDLTTVSADYVPGVGARAVLTPEADPFAEPMPEPLAAPRPRMRWGRYLAAGLGGLLALAIGLAIDALIRDLFSRYEALGWLGVGLCHRRRLPGRFVNGQRGFRPPPASGCGPPSSRPPPSRR